MNNITKKGLLPGLTAIVLCIALPVRAKAGKPPHGDGSDGGLPYATASTVSQLIADINYANSAGGVITINLAPGATFDLKSANNSTDGGNGLPVIGGMKAVNLTIIGHGDTIERIAVLGRYRTVKNPFNLLDVAAGSALTLDRVTLKGGWSDAILNHGTLNVIDGSTFSGNTYGVYNDGGTATISDSAFSDNGYGIYNAGGTLTANNATLSNNSTGLGNANGTVAITDCTLADNLTDGYGGGIGNYGGTVTISDSTLSGNSARYGGGIFNNAGTVTVNGCNLSGNSAYHSDYPWTTGNGGGIYNLGGSVTISNSTLSGNSADSFTGGGGGIYNNDPSSTVTVENHSSITGNSASDASADVENFGVLYKDGTSTIEFLSGNAAIPF
jgi:hypothetical protein